MLLLWQPLFAKHLNAQLEAKQRAAQQKARPQPAIAEGGSVNTAGGGAAEEEEAAVAGRRLGEGFPSPPAKRPIKPPVQQASASPAAQLQPTVLIRM